MCCARDFLETSVAVVGILSVACFAQTCPDDRLSWTRDRRSESARSAIDAHFLPATGGSRLPPPRPANEPTRDLCCWPIGHGEEGGRKRNNTTVVLRVNRIQRATERHHNSGFVSCGHDLNFYSRSTAQTERRNRNLHAFQLYCADVDFSGCAHSNPGNDWLSVIQFAVSSWSNSSQLACRYVWFERSCKLIQSKVARKGPVQRRLSDAWIRLRTFSRKFRKACR